MASIWWCWSGAIWWHRSDGIDQEPSDPVNQELPDPVDPHQADRRQEGPFIFHPGGFSWQSWLCEIFLKISQTETKRNNSTSKITIKTFTGKMTRTSDFHRMNMLFSPCWSFYNVKVDNSEQTSFILQWKTFNNINKFSSNFSLKMALKTLLGGRDVASVHSQHFLYFFLSFILM